MVAIPNHHFFQWANQLERSGYEVYWFDITDGAGFSNKIKWVKQFNGWKLKWDFPLRHRIKKQLPGLYRFIQRFNENPLVSVFERVVLDVAPDVIHVFEMHLSGIPVLSVLQKHPKIPLFYSSWGSDVYAFKSFGLTTTQVKKFLNRVDYLITDCERDFRLLQSYGYTNSFLGVFPGNGGISLPETAVSIPEARHLILIKGYEDGVGQASVVLNALSFVSEELLANYTIVVFSADDLLIRLIEASAFLSTLNLQILPRKKHVANETLLQLMGKSILYVGNSLSDGMPNTLLEAMGMGAFPIQSNPGGATAEVLQHGINGFLIENPTDSAAIASLIEEVLTNENIRKTAQAYNIDFVAKHYNRRVLQSQIQSLYKNINPL